MKNKWKIVAAAALVAAGTQAAFVTIGDPNNAADPSTGNGAVGYTYKISDHEVTISEFQAATGAGNGNENYWNDGSRSVGPNAPASYVSLFESMKYCNYLTSGDINHGYYSTSDGGSTFQPNVLSHDAFAAANGTTYFIPTEDEWYKAAYFTGDSADYWSLYANGTDTTPTWGTTSGWNYYNNGYVNGAPNYMWESGFGGVEQNGTYDMMGNEDEWTEDSSGVLRGGGAYSPVAYLKSSTSLPYDPSSELQFIGFRPVEISPGAVPEPASIALIGVLGGCALFIRRIFLI